MVGKLGCQQYRGAPLIVLNSEPSWDHRNYTGPAAHNPYYGTCTRPTREGDVRGFDKWFQTITVGPQNNCVWPSAYSATEEGAQEALCIVQEYVPEVKILAYRFVGQDGGPVSYAIELPDGMRLNAGLLLDAYYHQGWGGIPTPTPLFASRSVGRPTRQRQRGPPRSSTVHFVFVGRTSGLVRGPTSSSARPC